PVREVAITQTAQHASRLQRGRQIGADLTHDLLRFLHASLGVDDVVIQLLDHVADRLQLTDRRLAGVRRSNRLRASLPNALQRLLRDARLVGRAFGFGELRRDLLLLLLAQLQHLLEAELERAHLTTSSSFDRSGLRSRRARVSTYRMPNLHRAAAA